MSSFWFSNAALLFYLLSQRIHGNDNNNNNSNQQIVLSRPVNTPKSPRKTPVKIAPSFSTEYSNLGGPYDRLHHLFVKIYSHCFDLVSRSLKPVLIAMLEETTQKDTGVKNMIAFLSRILTILQQNFVNLNLAQHFFKQIFYFINAAIFNEIMLRRDLCTSRDLIN